MPSRILREGINSSPSVNQISPLAELFYRRLMSVVDDYGRFFGAPGTLRGACWPTCPEKVTDGQIMGWLEECSEGEDPLVAIYEIKGCTYLEILNFGQQKRGKSKFPERLTDAKQVQSTCESPVHASRISYFVNRISESESDAVAAPRTPATVHEIKPQNGDQWFEEIYTRHPKKKDRGLAQSNLAQSASQPDFDAEEFDRVHKLWCFEWAADKPQFAPTLAQWILDKGWKYPPKERDPTGTAKTFRTPREQAQFEALMRD